MSAINQENFFNYRGYRWLWISIVALMLFIIFYICDHPVGGRNGGTTLGLVYGVLAALGIIYLMMFGIRKRAYYSYRNSVKSWLGAHVWLGILLLFLVPLHSGFLFGWNVHTLTYLLMTVTIVSGIWGAFAYATMAPQIGSHRGEGTQKSILQEINIISKEIESIVRKASPRIGRFVAAVDFEFSPNTGKSLKAINVNTASALMAELSDEDKDQALKIVSLVTKKHDLCTRILKEARTLNILRAWLYIHLPVSFALLIALAIHIFSELYYW